jgi:hypothetical protein
MNNHLRIARVVFALFSLLGLGGCQLYYHLAQPKLVSSSPDERFDVKVYAYPLPRLAMPGQGGDTPGIIKLVDTKTGRTLEQEDVPMLWMIGEIIWEPERVEIPGLIIYWDLPK